MSLVKYFETKYSLEGQYKDKSDNLSFILTVDNSTKKISVGANYDEVTSLHSIKRMFSELEN